MREGYTAVRLLMYRGIYVCSVLLCTAFSMLIARTVYSGNEAGAWQRPVVATVSLTARQSALCSHSTRYPSTVPNQSTKYGAWRVGT
jgi:hypothetical protein